MITFSIPNQNKIAVKIMHRTVVRITDGFFSFSGRRSVTSDRLTSSPSRHASAAAIKVINTKTATTSSSVKDQERWITFREKTFPTVRTSISRVDTTRIQFSTAATAFMIFLKTFMISPPLNLLVRFSSFVKWNYLLCSRSAFLPGRAFV